MNRTDLPTFIIGGAPRCGTTWLYIALDTHPDIYMAKPITPEPKFFLVDSLFEQGIEVYKKWFKNHNDRLMAGEKSTNYLESTVTAKRIHDHLPDIRLIFLLRNPIHRAFSNYLWSRQNGLETETFENALDLEVEREQNCPMQFKFSRPHALFSRGLYADHLEPFFQLFPHENILCLRYEDLIDDPVQLLISVHRFLELQIYPEHAKLEVINSISDRSTTMLSDKIYRRLKTAYRGPNQRLEQLLNRKMGW